MVGRRSVASYRHRPTVYWVVLRNATPTRGRLRGLQCKGRECGEGSSGFGDGGESVGNGSPDGGCGMGRVPPLLRAYVVACRLRSRSSKSARK